MSVTDRPASTRPASRTVDSRSPASSRARPMVTAGYSEVSTAMLCCYQAIRTLISHASGDAGLDPARISFTRARDGIRGRISDSGCFSP